MARVRAAMDRALESGGATEVSVSDKASVVELANGAGINALVGFKFYDWEQGDYGRNKVRVEKVNPDGQTLSGMDVWEKRLINKNMFPGELTVCAESRAEDDPVIRFLKQVTR
jgi:hypothetical protein